MEFGENCLEVCVVEVAGYDKKAFLVHSLELVDSMRQFC